MARDIRPLETRYKGFRFRSRLEARWAVFFDSLDVPYEYELEGFALPSGGAYLPDFYLPSLDIFVEVKPNAQIRYEDLRRMVEFAVHGEKKLLLILGTPTQEEMFLVTRTSGSLDEIKADLGDSSGEGEIVESFLEALREWNYVEFGSVPLQPGWTLVYRSMPPYEDYHIRKALLDAKQARFEFGEQPGTDRA